jgi:hypothetical protein
MLAQPPGSRCPHQPINACSQCQGLSYYGSSRAAKRPQGTGGGQSSVLLALFRTASGASLRVLRQKYVFRGGAMRGGRCTAHGEQATATRPRPVPLIPIA